MNSFNSNKKMVIFLSPDQDILNVNQYICECLSIPKEKLLNQKLNQFIHDDNLYQFEKNWFRLLKFKKSICFDSRFQIENQKEINAQFRFEADVNEHNQVEQITAIISLISQNTNEFHFTDILDYSIVEVWSKRKNVEEAIIDGLVEIKKCFPFLSCGVALIDFTNKLYDKIICIEHHEYYQHYLKFIQKDMARSFSTIEVVHDLDICAFKFHYPHHILVDQCKVKSYCVLPLKATDQLFYGQFMINHSLSYSEILENLELLKSFAKLCSLIIEYALWQNYYYEIEASYQELLHQVNLADKNE